MRSTPCHSTKRGSRPGPAEHRRAPGWTPPVRHATVAREQNGGYDATTDGERGPTLRAAVREARDALGRVLALASDPGEPQEGELGGLLGLLDALDTGHAAAVELTATARRHDLAERATALPLDGLLAFRSRATYGDRATLAEAADLLARMPNLRAAFHAGAVGWAEVRTILRQCRNLDAAQRAELDAGFADHDRLGRLEPDRVVDAVDERVAQLRPDLERDRAKRRIEQRYLALQPALDGAGSGYFELDAAAYAPVVEAIQAAMPPPSAGPADVTRHAPGEGHPASAEGAYGDEHGPAAHADPEDPDHGDATAVGDPLERRSRGRQRADGLVRLAEAFLGAGAPAADGSHGSDDPSAGQTARRPLPALHAVCDLATLTGHDARARSARALVASAGGPVRLTPETARRLACDARLSLVFTENGRILGSADPTETVPAPLRRAIHARDQGCRFPGCTAPVHWCDAHHVVFRRDDGPTTADNLVTLCRRHHTAVHEGGWRLSMAPDGTITVRRGRQRHTSDPPLRRTLAPP